MPVADLVERIGHDGSDLPYEGDFAEYRAGFHVDELLEVLEDLGWAATPFQYAPCVVPQPEAPPRYIYEDPDTRFLDHVMMSKGFILGYLMKDDLTGHAVTNIKGTIIDPRGQNSTYMVQDMHLYSFVPTTYFKVSR
jgi:hypothetical protein